MSKLNLTKSELETLANANVSDWVDNSIEELMDSESAIANTLHSAAGLESVGITEHAARYFADDLGNDVLKLKIIEFSNKFFFTSIGDDDTVEQFDTFEQAKEEFDSIVAVWEEEAEIIAGL